MDVQIPCPCPPKADGAKRHDMDIVTLADTLNFRRTLTVRQAIRTANRVGEVVSEESLTLDEITAVMVEAYLLYCIDAWTLVDTEGKPIPPTKSAIRAFIEAHVDEAETVGDAADDLYSEKVVLPLLNRASTSSPATPTPDSTSAKNGHSPRPRKPSKRSSTTTIPTVVTGPMAASPGGVSSSSLS